MSVHSLRLPSNLEKDLTDLVNITGRTKTYFITEAIKNYLEDRQDYLKAASILEKVESGEMKTKSLREVMAKYGLEN